MFVFVNNVLIIFELVKGRGAISRTISLSDCLWINPRYLRGWLGIPRGDNPTPCELIARKISYEWLGATRNNSERLGGSWAGLLSPCPLPKFGKGCLRHSEKSRVAPSFSIKALHHSGEGWEGALYQPKPSLSPHLPWAFMVCSITSRTTP